ncbi:MAG: spore coat associated protein CotJA [Clostridiales bacterium]|nr:spore coat associated protein CotJA [Eubacteriales bacterium]MDH7565191.1 spore coat associated protein CotJA [Clostridiales bacterium]
MPNEYYAPTGYCIPQETVLTNVKLANAYVPFQNLCTTFPPVESLSRGTAFPELYSPYRSPDKPMKTPRYE